MELDYIKERVVGVDISNETTRYVIVDARVVPISPIERGTGARTLVELRIVMATTVQFVQLWS